LNLNSQSSNVLDNSLKCLSISAPASFCWAGQDAVLARELFLNFFKDLVLLIGVVKILDKLYNSFNSISVRRILQNIFD
jgi:hypothetical protein